MWPRQPVRLLSEDRCSLQGPPCLGTPGHHLWQKHPPFPTQILQASSSLLSLPPANQQELPQATDASYLTRSGEAIRREYPWLPTTMKFSLA